MKSIDGEYTGDFGLWLARYLKGSSQFSVYHDHGKRQEDPTVAAIKGFWGHEVSNRNRLTDIDVMVVNKASNEVVLLIEIEESQMPPKKLLGDIFAAIMCNHFAVRIENKNRNFALSSRTRLIVAGVDPNSTEDQNIAESAIKERFGGVAFPDNAIPIENIKVITKGDISKTLKALQDEVMGIFPMGQGSGTPHTIC